MLDFGVRGVAMLSKREKPVVAAVGIEPTTKGL